MESEAVRRRMHMIAAHFAPTDDTSPTHLLPMNCSGSLNTIAPRCDNRMCFARQGSTSQAFFMGQVSTEQQQSSSHEAPLFSRPARVEHNFSNLEPTHFPAQDCYLPTTDLPNFARPTAPIAKEQHSHCNNNIYSSKPNGIDWSPRMDVAESRSSYVVTLEIPGVNANDIKVEVNETNLTIMGRRSIQWWRSVESISVYHKREIREGPYQVVWPLPSNVNKDGVFAEFLDGILQIIIPKL